MCSLNESWKSHDSRTSLKNSRDYTVLSKMAIRRYPNSRKEGNCLSSSLHTVAHKDPDLLNKGNMICIIPLFFCALPSWHCWKQLV